MRYLFLTCLYFAATFDTDGAVILNPGDSYEWQFTLAPGGSFYATSARFYPPDTLEAGDSLQVRFYEGDTFGAPVFTQILHGSSSSGQLRAALWDFTDQGFFQNRIGVWELQMLTGSVNLGNLYVATEINGSRYSAQHTPVNVPEPKHAALILPIIIFGHTLIRRRNNAIPANRGMEQREAAPTERSP